MTGEPMPSDSGEPTRRPTPPTNGMPRWVKVFLIVLLVLVLALVISRLAGVSHGPGLHH